MADTNQTELDTARASIEAETQRALQIIRAETRAEQASALHEVATAAVDRTLGTVKEVRTWLAFIVTAISLVLALFSFFGINALKSWVSKISEDRLTSWLSMDTDAPMRIALEDLRRRAIVDAYLIREARTRTRDGRGGMKLAASELANLLIMLRDPKTDDWEFNSVARVIAFSELDPGFLYRNDEMDKLLEAVFQGAQYSTTKRCDLLRLWRRYGSIGSIAEQILRASDKHSDHLVHAAFVAASDSEREAARDYVTRTLKSSTETPGAVEPSEMLTFMLKNDALNEVAWRWVNSAPTRAMEQAPLLFASAASAICSDLEMDKDVSHRYSQEERAKASQRAARLLSDALKAGVRIRPYPNRIETRLYPSFHYHAKSRKEYFAPLDDLSGWLRCDTVVDLALKESPLTVGDLISYIDALQIASGEHEIASIVGRLQPHGAVEMTDGTIVTSLDTDEPILFRTRTFQVKQLWASWRTRNGAYEAGSVAKIETSGIDFSYRFDRDSVFHQVYIRRDFHDESLL